MMKKRKNPLWKIQEAEIPGPFRVWVGFSGSFMQRLVQQGINNARIQVLQEGFACPETEERKLLGIEDRKHALVREVLIVSVGKQWMFARTVIPRTTLTGEQQQLAQLKDRSLGSVLFKDPTMKRSAFEIACLQPGERWHDKVKQAADCALPDLWARRSLFSVRDKPLLLTEVFLPDIATV